MISTIVFVALLAHAAAGCLIGSNQLVLSITDDTPAGTIIGTAKKDSVAVSCSSAFFSVADRGEELDVVLEEDISDSFDQGYTEPVSFTLCTCQNASSPVFSILVTVNDANNRAPQFVGVAGGVVDIQVDQATGPGLDLAHLVGGGQLGVYDDDLSELRQRLTLSVDNEDDLVVLPEVLAARKRNPTNASDPLMASVQYPRFALKRRLSQDTTFNLIATDNGNPKRSCSLQINVRVRPSDLEDPRFLEDFYSATVSDPQYTGPLAIDQGFVEAVDGDDAIGAAISYAIQDSGGADVSVSRTPDGKAIVFLAAPIDSQALGKDTLVVVIKARQEDDETRSAKAVLVVQVPAPLTTTPQPTTTTTEEPVTCPVCPTTSRPTECPQVTCPTLTCPTTVTPTQCPEPTYPPTTPCPTPEAPPECPTPTAVTCSCPETPCPTTVTPTRCPELTYPPTTTCPTPGPPPECPTCPAETCPTTTDAPLTCPPSSCPNATDPTPPATDPTPPANECPPCSCPNATDPTPPASECPPCSPSTCPTAPFSTECPPTTCTCPETTCPTFPTTEPVTQGPTCPPTTCTCPETTCPSSVPPEGECPLTCPSTAATSTTTPAPPVVVFERQFYSATAPHLFNGLLFAVRATASDGQAVAYGSKADDHLAVDAASGEIRTVVPLPPGTYELNVTAEASGATDSTRVLVQVSRPWNDSACVRFEAPLYQFTVDEGRDQVVLGRVSLSPNTTDWPPIVWWTRPDRFSDRFDVTPEGYVRLVRAIGRAEATRVWLGLRTDDDDDDGAPTAATVVEIGVEDVNEAPRFDAYPPTLVVGYPTRTVLDPSVPMPLFAFDAADADDGANAALSYALAAPSADGFHLGAADGVLAVRGVDRLPDCSTDAAGCRLQVVATDGGGLRAQQNVAVVGLADDRIHRLVGRTVAGVVRLNDAPTDAQIEADLGRVLDCDLRLLTRRPADAVDADAFEMVVYATRRDQQEPLSRAELQQLVDDALLDQLDGWTLDAAGGVGVAPAYQVASIIDSRQNLLVSTAVLGSLLGLALLAAAGVLAAVAVRKRRLGGNSRKLTDGESSASSDGISEKAKPSPSSSLAEPASPKIVQSEEPYEPATPPPKKSILKETKVVERNEPASRSLQFSTQPEMITVAGTRVLQLELDSDIEIEEL